MANSFLFITMITTVLLFSSSCDADNRPPPASLGNIGVYTTIVSLGTPATQFKAMVDVAGDFIWVQCGSNSLDGPVFIPDKSSTFQLIPCDDQACQNLEKPICGKDNTCQYGIPLPDGQLAIGVYSRDALIIPTPSKGDVTVPHARIACGDEDKSFMGRKVVRVGVPGLLQETIQPFNFTFSHCFQRKQSINDDGDSHLRLGDDAVMLGNQTTPAIWCSLGGKYLSRQTLGLEDITVGTWRMRFPPGTFVSKKKCGVVLDSGTAVTYLPGDALKRLVAQISADTEKSSIIPEDDFWHLCYKGTRDDLAKQNSGFLSLTLHFEGGLDVVLNPLDLYVPIDANTVCLLMSETDDITVLGSYALQDKNVWYGFSTGNNKAFSIAATTC